eukprot:gene25326-10980_t
MSRSSNATAPREARREARGRGTNGFNQTANRLGRFRPWGPICQLTPGAATPLTPRLDTWQVGRRCATTHHTDPSMGRILKAGANSKRVADLRFLKRRTVQKHSHLSSDLN